MGSGLDRRGTAARLRAKRREAEADRRSAAERRVYPRRGLELLLDSLLRPRQWGARLAYALRLQGAGVELSTHLIPVPRRTSGRPLRIGFASDFHAGPTTDARIIDEACDLLAAADIDLLLLGGDFVSVRARYAVRVARAIKRIAAPLGKFAVLGNHDLRANSAEVTEALKGAGVQFITNRSVVLAEPHSSVSVVGLDDSLYGDPDPEAAFQDALATRIVLMHSPDGLLEIGDRQFALALCGHTHGGQIALPGGFPLYLPAGRLSRDFPSGLYRLGGEGEQALLVSRGVGCSTVPVRLFAKAQVHVITLG